MIVSKSRFVLAATIVAATAWADIVAAQVNVGGVGAGAAGAASGAAGAAAPGIGAAGSTGPTIGAAGQAGAKVGAGATAPGTTPGGVVNPGATPQVPAQTPGVGPQVPNPAATGRVVPPQAGQQPGQRVGQQPVQPGQRIGQQPVQPGQRVGQQPVQPGQQPGLQLPGQQSATGQRIGVQPGLQLPGQQTTLPGRQTNTQSNPATIQQGVNLTAGAGGTIQVGSITQNSWAQQAGLQQNDQIRALNGQPIADPNQLFAQLRQAALQGAPAQLTVVRNGQPTTIPLNVAQLFGSAGVAGQTNIAGNVLNLQQGVSLVAGPGGTIQVGQININSWAQQAGLQTNDRLVSLNGQPIADQQQFFAQLQSAAQLGAPVQLAIERNGQQQVLPLNLPQIMGNLGASAGAAVGTAANLTPAAAAANPVAGGAANANVGANRGLQDGITIVRAGEGQIMASQVDPTSWAGIAGIKPNDMIVSVGGKPVNNEANFFAQLQAQAQVGSPVTVLVDRGGQFQPVAVDLSAFARGNTAAPR